ncbi:MAG: hypothetical protein AAB596_02985 [Patescibacteria group bacterium]
MESAVTIRKVLFLTVLLTVLFSYTFFELEEITTKITVIDEQISKSGKKLSAIEDAIENKIISEEYEIKIALFQYACQAVADRYENIIKSIEIIENEIEKTPRASEFRELKSSFGELKELIEKDKILILTKMEEIASPEFRKEDLSKNFYDDLKEKYEYAVEIKYGLEEIYFTIKSNREIEI